MKNTYSFILIITLFLGVEHSAIGQDLIVSAKGDSLNVRIISETTESITFRYQVNTFWHTMNSSKSSITSIERDFYRSNIHAGVALALLGGTTLISIGPEFQVPLNKVGFVALKSSIGYNEEFFVITLFGEPREPEKFVNVVNHFTVNFGRKKHFLEVGFGFDHVNSSYGNNGWIGYGLAGYRYQKERTMMKLFILPGAFGSIPERMTMSPIGGSIGFRF